MNIRNVQLSNDSGVGFFRENAYDDREQERRRVFEKKIEIFQRVREWRMENERLG